MRNLVLIFTIAVLMVACKKEDEVKPTQPPTQEEYDCDSHPMWWIQLYQTCEMTQVTKHLLTNEESKRIDSSYVLGDCLTIEVTDVNNEKHSGNWLYPMYGRKTGGKVNFCSRYGKD